MVYRPTVVDELFRDYPYGQWNSRPAPPPSTLQRTTRIALQLSGHVRETCASRLHLAQLLAVVQECRAVALCDVFLHTWKVLTSGSARDALPCANQLRALLSIVAIAVEPEPRWNTSGVWDSFLPPERQNATASASSSNASAHQQLPLAAIESCAYGVVAAAALRRSHEAHAGLAYDVAVRLRPDLYRTPHGRYWGSEKEWLTYAFPPSTAWTAMVEIAQTEMNGTATVGCGPWRPGDKSADNCFFARPSRLDAVLEHWQRSLPEHFKRHHCWQRAVRAELQQGTKWNRAIGHARRRCGAQTGQWSETLLVPALLASGGSRISLHSVGCFGERASCAQRAEDARGQRFFRVPSLSWLNLSAFCCSSCIPETSSRQRVAIIHTSRAAYCSEPLHRWPPTAKVANASWGWESLSPTLRTSLGTIA